MTIIFLLSFLLELKENTTDFTCDVQCSCHVYYTAYENRVIEECFKERLIQIIKNTIW